MAVLITGMNMPKSCGDCEFHWEEDVSFDICHRCQITGQYINNLDVCSFPYDCPLSEVPESCEDAISREAARHALCKAVHKDKDVPCENQTASCLWSKTRVCDYAREIDDLPSVMPVAFHNTTMSEVLRYIDDMPEDVWQEFTACLECRGWNLEKKTTVWCGSEFA